MKTNELRVGNLIHFLNYDSKYSEITAIYFDCLYFHAPTGSEGMESHSLAEPIPLTEEWLLKFGFTPDKHNLVYDHPSPKEPENEHKDLGTKYPSFFFNKRLNRWMDCQTRVCVDYVHQLQNFYFALTGEELISKW